MVFDDRHEVAGESIIVRIVGGKTPVVPGVGIVGGGFVEIQDGAEPILVRDRRGIGTECGGSVGCDIHQVVVFVVAVFRIAVLLFAVVRLVDFRRDRVGIVFVGHGQ